MEDRVAIVTGGASGIGRATALELAKSGLRVVISDVNDEAGNAVVESLRADGRDAIFVHTDVSRTQDVEHLIASTIDTFGRLDMACNNAGFDGPIGRLLDQTEDALSQVLAVNVHGTFNCMRAEIAHMLTAGGGAIVNIASVAGLVGMPKMSLYSAAKHAVVGLTRTAAIEYAAKNISINAVCPGGIETPMLQRLSDHVDPARTQGENLARAHPAKRLGRPEEVAAVIAFYLMGRSGFSTGAVVPVDGGYSAG
ncbi:MAG: glucose 1-dehydrogenase [Pseudomonadota bacterium]|nr:glucose 1-dehydrogenase [Pseudomonadota bacterium]